MIIDYPKVFYNLFFNILLPYLHNIILVIKLLNVASKVIPCSISTHEVILLWMHDFSYSCST